MVRLLIISIQWNNLFVGKQLCTSFIFLFLFFQTPSTSKAQESIRLKNGYPEIESCVNCHGSNDFLDATDPEDIWRSSYQIWRVRDPHGKAFDNLFSDRSQKIVSALAGKSILSKDEYHSIVIKNCISCHSTVSDSSLNKLRAGSLGLADTRRELETGIQCHACHTLDNGREAEWTKLHVKQDWYDDKDDKSKFAFNDMSNLSTRASTCADCHVGSKSKDVNHDLIAAGHPRLVFEFSSHLERLPLHWHETNESDSFHQDCWSIGQLAIAEAALNLLKQRVQTVDEVISVPWPELSVYNCMNCHHDLVKDWYVGTDSKIARPQWGTWDFALRFDTNQNWDAYFKSLEAQMESGRPDPGQIAELVAEVSRDLGNHTVIPNAKSFISRTPKLDLDDMLSWYLAAASCYRDIAKNYNRDGNRNSTSLKELRKLLFEDYRSLVVGPLENGNKKITDKDSIENEIRSRIKLLANKKKK